MGVAADAESGGDDASDSPADADVALALRRNDAEIRLAEAMEADTGIAKEEHVEDATGIAKDDPKDDDAMLDDLMIDDWW